MGYQLSGETWISSGQNWPESCQGEPTLGLEVLLRIRGDDGQGWIPEVLKKKSKKVQQLKSEKKC